MSFLDSASTHLAASSRTSEHRFLEGAKKINVLSASFVIISALCEMKIITKVANINSWHKVAALMTFI